MNLGGPFSEVTLMITVAVTVFMGWRLSDTSTLNCKKKKKNQFIYMYINNHIQSFTSFELKKNLQLLFSSSNILTYIIINYCCKYMHLSS